ncbi:hypothetical protein [Psychromicrobium sp. YIM B11713]|uniref:hypothetical protein n=1 Tax=Psychromicrobium sp. YIM B11713 TaxID=3145233 RepID=UPI00374E71E2
MKILSQGAAKRLTRNLAIGVVAVGLLASFAPASATAKPIGGDDTVTVGEKHIKTSSAESGGTPEDAWICTALQKVDLPHISSTASVRAVQAHGAWNKGDCQSDAAVVTTQIDRQGFLNNFFAVGTQGKGTLQSTNGMPSGSNNRVTAQYVCQGTGQGRFRAWTDVDVIGIADLPNKVYSAETNIACG